MNILAIIIIVLVLGMVIGNIMLLKHTAKFSMKSLKQDPIERAKERLEQRKLDQDK